MKQYQAGLVSVVIPTYGARGNLRGVIDSVRSQDYTSVEIIVVDDNNPETEERRLTEILMAGYSSDDRVIYIKHEKNKNGAAARNTGINASNGEYIAFLDDDDMFLPNKLSRQVHFLREHPEYDAAYCYAAGDNKSCVLLQGDLRRQLLLLQTRMRTSSLIFSRQSIFELGGFDVTYRRHQDYELLMRFFNHGYLIGCVAEPLIQIGENAGENALGADKLCVLKQTFLEQFWSQIEQLDDSESNYKNRVISKHYATVVIAYLKESQFSNACKIFWNYCRKAPCEFFHVIFSSVNQHIKRLVIKR